MMCVVVLTTSVRVAGERPRSDTARSLLSIIALEARWEVDRCRASSAARTRSSGLD